MSEVREDPAGSPNPCKQPLVLAIPWFHEQMAPPFPVEVCFFDPGIDQDQGTKSWRPPELPLSRDMVRSFLRESTSFAQERARGKAVLSASALMGDDYYAHTALAIQSRLTGGTGAAPQPDAALRCHQILLLAWQHEEQVLEIQGIQHTIQAGFQDLEQSLGVEDSEDYAEVAQPRHFLTPPETEQALPWPLVLEAILFFLPPETILVTSLQEIADSLTEIASSSETELRSGGIPEHVFAAVENSGSRIVRAPGWKLLGKTRCPKDKPWLAANHFIFLALLQSSDPGRA